MTDDHRGDAIADEVDDRGIRSAVDPNSNASD